jgi:transcriptional regulator with XRE-family HTH domain
MNFTSVVKERLKETGMKRSVLARATGYSAQHIYDLLSGERRWNEESINKVCEVLGLKVEVVAEEKDGDLNVVRQEDQTLPKAARTDTIRTC